MRRSNESGCASVAATVLIAALLTINLSAVAMAASAGSLDPTFGTAGRVTTNVAIVDSVNDVAIQPDGKIIVAGSTNNLDPSSNFGLVRYNPNGTLDTTFSGDGVVTTDFTGVSDSCGAVAIQPDGTIVAVGSSQGGTPSTVAVARYLPNGSLDTTFDGDGRFTFDVPGNNDSLSAVAIQADGKIVAGGSNNSNSLLIRLNQNGSLDTTFDTDGVVTSDLGGTADEYEDIVIQADGKIVAAGTAGSSPNATFGVARYLASGALDTTFSTDGIAVTDMGNGNDNGRGLLIQPDGQYVVAGVATIAGATDIALARYNSVGSLDTNFDGDGRVITDLGGSGSGEDVMIQNDGRLIVAARSANNFAALRYNINGTLDTGFGNGGIVLTDIAAGNERPSEGSLYGDKLIIAGEANGNDDFAVARYNLLPAPTATADFDADGISDFSVFRPSSGTWFILNSSTNTASQQVFGQNGDIPVDGDFDGDARADIAVWRPSSGTWFFIRSSTGTTGGAPWGAAGDKPVPGDYDKDGKTDFAVWRPSDGLNYIVRSSNNSFFGVQWGVSGDIPLMGAAQ